MPAWRSDASTQTASLRPRPRPLAPGAFRGVATPAPFRAGTPARMLRGGEATRALAARSLLASFSASTFRALPPLSSGRAARHVPRGAPALPRRRGFASSGGGSGRAGAPSAGSSGRRPSRPSFGESLEAFMERCGIDPARIARGSKAQTGGKAVAKAESAAAPAGAASAARPLTPQGGPAADRPPAAAALFSPTFTLGGGASSSALPFAPPRPPRAVPSAGGSKARADVPPAPPAGVVEVASSEGEETLTIRIDIGGKARNLCRSRSEPLSAALSRLAAVAAPAAPGMLGRGLHARGPRPHVRLFERQSDGSLVDVGAEAGADVSGLAPGARHGPSGKGGRGSPRGRGASPLAALPRSATNDGAWLDGRILDVGGRTYVVRRDPPGAAAARVLGKPFAGAPVVAQAVFAHSSPGRLDGGRGATSAGASDAGSESRGIDAEGAAQSAAGGAAAGVPPPPPAAPTSVAGSYFHWLLEPPAAAGGDAASASAIGSGDAAVTQGGEAASAPIHPPPLDAVTLPALWAPVLAPGRLQDAAPAVFVDPWIDELPKGALLESREVRGTPPLDESPDLDPASPLSGALGALSGDAYRGTAALTLPEASEGWSLSAAAVPGRVSATSEATAGSALWAAPADARVAARPLHPARERRLREAAESAPARGSGTFRVVTYNVLADQYASPTRVGQERAKALAALSGGASGPPPPVDPAPPELPPSAYLFTHMRLEHLSPAHRRPLLTHELLTLRPTIALLQEVDESFFRTFLEPCLRSEAGLEGAFTAKRGRVQEGCATFHDASRLQKVVGVDLTLSDMLVRGAATAAPQSEDAYYRWLRDVEEPGAEDDAPDPAAVQGRESVQRLVSRLRHERAIRRRVERGDAEPAVRSGASAANRGGRQPKAPRLRRAMPEAPCDAAGAAAGGLGSKTGLAAGGGAGPSRGLAAAGGSGLDAGLAAAGGSGLEAGLAAAGGTGTAAGLAAVADIAGAGGDGDAPDDASSAPPGTAPRPRSPPQRVVYSLSERVAAALLRERGQTRREARPLLDRSPELVNALRNVGTIAQISLFQVREGERVANGCAAKGGEDAPSGAPSSPSPASPALSASSPFLCVVNTHLFYHGDAPHIRALHAWGAARAAEAVVEAALTHFYEDRRDRGGDACPPPRPPPVAMVIAGDLNSDANGHISGVSELFERGWVDEEHVDWRLGAAFRWGRKNEAEDVEDRGATEAAQAGPEGAGEEALASAAPGAPKAPERAPGLSLELSRSFASSLPHDCGYSNVVTGYKGLLDYIWLDSRLLTLENALGLLSEDELAGVLPSEAFPSDHVPLVADLRFATPGRDGRRGDGGGSRASAGAAPDGWTRIVSIVGPADGDDADRAASQHPPAAAPSALVEAAEEVAALLRHPGSIAAVPTDTLYGLAARASDRAAVRALARAKRRVPTKPIALAVADPEDVARVADLGASAASAALVRELLPGPVTLLLPVHPSLPLAPSLASQGVVGVRVPDAPFVRALARSLGEPLALTSANLAGAASTVAVDEFADLWPACAAVVDGGTIRSNGRTGSTIVDLTVPGAFRVVREGSTVREIRESLAQTHGLRESTEDGSDLGFGSDTSAECV